MRLLLLVALIVLCSRSALARTSECSAVPKASDRLACYDLIALPLLAKPTKQKAAASKTSDQAKAVDALAAETLNYRQN
jgi:hypothetical protein